MHRNFRVVGARRDARDLESSVNDPKDGREILESWHIRVSTA